MNQDSKRYALKQREKVCNDLVKPSRTASFFLEKMMRYVVFGILFLIPALAFTGCGGDASEVEDLRKEVEKLRAEVRTLRSTVNRTVSRPSIKGHDIGGHAHASDPDGKTHKNDHIRKMYKERRKGTHDLEFREKMKDPEFRKKMRDPEFRRKIREERRNRRMGTNTVSSATNN